MKWQDRLVALAIVAVWGFNFVVIKWGVTGIPPFLLGGLRFTAVVALAMFFVRRPAIPWRWLALYGLSVGFLQFACLFTAIRVGMPPGLASIVQQSQAFFTLLIALLWLKAAGRWQHPSAGARPPCLRAAAGRAVARARALSGVPALEARSGPLAAPRP